MMKDYPIVGSFDNQRSTVISAERTVNMFEYDDPDGKRSKVMIFTPGMVDTEIDFSVYTRLGARASFVYKNIMFQVFGADVFRFISLIDGSLSYSHIGTLSNTTGHVGIDANSYQVLFVDGTRGYVFDYNTGTFTQVTDSGFPSKPIDCCAIDGFLIVTQGETNTFYMSSYEQAMVWSGGDATPPTFTTNSAGAAPLNTYFTLSTSNANFATGVPIMFTTTGTFPTTTPTQINNTDTFYAVAVTASSTNPGIIQVATSYEDAIAGNVLTVTLDSADTHSVSLVGQLQAGSVTSHPGTIVGCRTLHRRVFFFCEYFTEVWENQGIGSNLPLRRNNSMLMEVGAASLGSIASAFDRMFFLAQTSNGLDSVMEVRGAQAIPVSNRALDYQLAQYAENPEIGVYDSVGFLTKEDGLIFYKLNFTRADHTYVYGVSTSEGMQPKWHEEEVLNGSRHPAQTHVYFNGKNYYGDYSQAKLYYSDNSVTTNNGEAIKRMRIGKTLAPEGYVRTRIDRFHLDLLQGNVPLTLVDETNLDAENSDDLLAEDGQLILLSQQQTTRMGQPIVYLSYSKDGGQTYGYRQKAFMGKLGQRTYRTVWRKLGVVPRGQGYTPKIEFFADIPFIILGAAWASEFMPE